MRIRPISISFAVLASIGTGCSVGGDDDTAPIQPTDSSPGLIFARSDRANRTQRTELRLRTRRGLNEARAVPERVGVEQHVRVHPDGIRIVYARSINAGDPSSSEIYTGTLDASVGEARLTVNSDFDGKPCWLGDRVLFVSDRGQGPRLLWTMDSDGSNPQPLMPTTDAQTDPDAVGNRVVFSSRAEFGFLNQGIWLLDVSSGALRRLTTGGNLSNGSLGGDPVGDFQPALSPDASSVLCIRNPGPVGGSQLMRIDRITGAASTIGEIARSSHPRWSPQQDSIFVARDLDPERGLEGARLHELAADGSDPVLLALDKRFDDLSFDPLPSLPRRPTLVGPERVATSAVTATTVFGSGSVGQLERLDDADGVVVSVFSGVSGDRDVAGLRLRVRLPVDSPLQIARYRVAMRIAVSRTDFDGILRLTLDNPSASRNDTVLELSPTDTSLHDYTFTAQSLAHVSRDGTMTMTAIVDMPAGDRVELAIDQFAIDTWTDGSMPTAPARAR